MQIKYLKVWQFELYWVVSGFILTPTRHFSWSSLISDLWEEHHLRWVNEEFSMKALSLEAVTVIFPWEDSNKRECRTEQSMPGKRRNPTFRFEVLTDRSNLKIQMYRPGGAVWAARFAFPVDFVLTGCSARSRWPPFWNVSAAEQSLCVQHV